MENKALMTQIPRSALMKILDNFSNKRGIYIHAPAGFGKTVSSLLWLAHREEKEKIKRIWVSLDEYDDKTSVFCRRFVSALVNAQPENVPLSELVSHPLFNSAAIEFTIRALGYYFINSNDKYIFVFDDLHVIKNEEILRLLPALFKRLSANCNVLLLSRAVPPESFSEMLAKEDIALVDAASLQFSKEEIKLLFNRNERLISSGQADEILASTGGWAIGIRALLLSDDKSFSINLNDKYLELFLKNHVWERWDEPTKYFMMMVSVVKELSPELCEWLTLKEKFLKGISSAEILERLVRENAFLRLAKNNIYRFHDLFREFLLNTLEGSDEKIMYRQFNRAGDYFYNKKDYFRAVQYYLKGKNDDGIAKSLFCMYDNNSPYASIEDTLYTVRLSVNDSIVEKHPFLLEVQAWGAFVEGQADKFEKTLDIYYKLFPKIVLQSPRSTVILALLRSIDYREKFVSTMKIINRVPFKSAVKAFTPSITHNMPFFHRSSRDFSELALNMEKNFVLLEKCFKNIFDAEFYLIKETMLAGIFYEKGNLPLAHEHALLACAKISDDCSAEIMFCAMMMMASVLYAEGQRADAEKMLTNVKIMIDQNKAFYLDANLKAYQFRLRLDEGDKKAAEEWLKDYNESLYTELSFVKMYQQFTTVRAYIVMNDSVNAIILLHKILKLSESYKRTIDIVEANILLAIVYWKKGQKLAAALEYLEKAIIIAYEFEFIQVFANEGAEIANILHRLQKRAVQQNYAGKIPSNFIKILHIAAVEKSKYSKGYAGGKIPVNTKFTDKQKMVMSLLSKGCSRNEIAEKMGIKPYTVKSHIELIYRKLDVSNNIEAVLKIKEYGIID
ncbi:MAG: LuxR C-terminal-related transcriptional regulator [Lachnospiraceae bacterium]|nr:LuxR C-terminal-related transcriptional regulator [Lachnospiraceae bacterium]